MFVRRRKQDEFCRRANGSWLAKDMHYITDISNISLLETLRREPWLEMYFSQDPAAVLSAADICSTFLVIQSWNERVQWLNSFQLRRQSQRMILLWTKSFVWEPNPRTICCRYGLSRGNIICSFSWHTEDNQNDWNAAITPNFLVRALYAQKDLSVQECIFTTPLARYVLLFLAVQTLH